MLLVAIGRVTQFVLLLLTLRLATGFLSPAEMGKISIVTATVGFFALFMLNPVGMFMNRRFHDWDLKGQVKNHLRYFWLYLAAISVLAVLLLNILVGFKIWKPSISLFWLSLLVCGSLIFSTVNQVVIPWLNMLGYRGWFMVLTIATAALSLILAVALVLMIAPTAEYWLCGLMAGQLIVGLIGKKLFFSRLQKSQLAGDALLKLSYAQIQNLLRFAWPIAIAVGLGWTQTQSYRYLVEYQLGLNDLGLFVAGYGISAGLITGFESIFSTYFLPKFYKRISKENIAEHTDAWHEYAQAVLPSLLLTGILIMVTAPELTVLLLGSAYRESSQFVVWGAFAELARIATAVFAMVAHARMNTKLLVLPNMVGAVMSVSLVWFLMPVFGANGVGLGLASASLAALLLTIFVTSKHIVLSLPRREFALSLVWGAALLIISILVRNLLGFDRSLLFSLVQLFVVGSFFLLFQYSILRPVLKKEKTSHLNSPHN